MINKYYLSTGYLWPIDPIFRVVRFCMYTHYDETNINNCQLEMSGPPYNIAINFIKSTNK